MARIRTVIYDLAAIVTLVVFGASAISFAKGLMATQNGLPTLFGLPRLQAILTIGLATAAAQYILWIAAERIFGWTFRAGSGRSLPEGWSAVVLSMTVTLPLATMPLIYTRIFQTQVVQHGHTLASCCMIAGGAFGHLILYGVDGLNIRGLKRKVFPLNIRANKLRVLAMELIFAIIHFSSIVLTYRFALEIGHGHYDASPFFPAFTSASLWFMGVSVVNLLRYPETVKKKITVEARGIINGLMLQITLQGGILM